MFAAEDRGEIKPGTARRWAHETKSIKKLPERAMEKRSSFQHGFEDEIGSAFDQGFKKESRYVYEGSRDRNLAIGAGAGLAGAGALGYGLGGKSGHGRGMKEGLDQGAKETKKKLRDQALKFKSDTRKVYGRAQRGGFKSGMKQGLREAAGTTPSLLNRAKATFGLLRKLK